VVTGTPPGPTGWRKDPDTAREGVDDA
jgi:hypothetical protein